MRPWRYLVDDSVGAAEGLALDEALANSHGRELEPAPVALRLYTYRSHAALCGRFQHLAAEIDVAACRRTETAYNRRPTGGGAIIMGEGQLGVAITAPAPARESPRSLLRGYSEGIVAGLRRLGIEAEFGGKNDLKVGECKIAGLGLYLDGRGGLLFHSSILADLDVPFMLDVLQIPAAKLGSGAVDAVERRVTTVSRETGREWNGKTLREIIAAGFAETIGTELYDSVPTSAERSRASHLLTSKYQTEEWIHQRSPQSDATATSLLRTPGGLVRLYLALSGNLVKSALFAGDFNELPPPLAEFEGRLKWSRLDPGALERLAAETMPAGSGLGVDNERLVDLVLETAQRARIREVSAPERTGSCYFPERTDDDWRSR